LIGAVLNAAGVSAGAFGAILADEMRLWAEVARQTGIKLTD
jgi:hypothetical protein